MIIPVQDKTQVGFLEPIEGNYDKPLSFECKVCVVELGYVSRGYGGRPLPGVVVAYVLCEVRAGIQAVSRVCVNAAVAPAPSLELCLGLRPMLSHSACGKGGGVGVVVLFPTPATWPPPALAR